MKHEEWKQFRCPYWDTNCMLCLRQDCLEDPEYEIEE